jgi:hypothetical protein
MKTLFLAWQDPQTRRWFPVGKLTFEDGYYRFVYTKGAKASENFIPFALMRDFSAVYRSSELFPLFANRLISKKRPEYNRILNWLDLGKERPDPLVLLARTEGIRETDSLTVFERPTPNEEGKYEVKFFSHGLVYLPEEAVRRIAKLLPGERLFLMLDPQNPYDRFAIALRTDDPATIVGYCPRYISHDFLDVLRNDLDSVRVTVKRVNVDAPIQLRLLCNLTFEWPANFQPCSSEYFEELASESKDSFPAYVTH